jgi:hypothetical protein
MAPVRAVRDADRGVISGGPVGSRMLGPLATVPLRDPPLARRCYPPPERDGRQSLTHQHQSCDGPQGARAGDILPPSSLGVATGEMWNSNSADGLAASPKRARHRPCSTTHGRSGARMGSRFDHRLPHRQRRPRRELRHDPRSPPMGPLVNPRCSELPACGGLRSAHMARAAGREPGSDR